MIGLNRCWSIERVHIPKTEQSRPLELIRMGSEGTVPDYTARACWSRGAVALQVFHQAGIYSLTNVGRSDSGCTFKQPTLELMPRMVLLLCAITHSHLHDAPPSQLSRRCQQSYQSCLPSPPSGPNARECSERSDYRSQ